MKIRVISNIGPREVTLTQTDPTIEDVMSSPELADFQVILPVCKDRQLTNALSETDSLPKQGPQDNSTIYCKFKLKEDETIKPSASTSVNKPTNITKTNKQVSSKIANRKPKPMEALSPMHIKRTVVTRKRPKVSSVDKLLFSPPPPDKKSQVAVASIPKLSMRQCNIASLDDEFMNDTDKALSPLRPAIRRKRNAEPSIDLFSPVAKSNGNADHHKKARLIDLATPPSVMQLQQVLDAEGTAS